MIYKTLLASSAAVIAGLGIPIWGVTAVARATEQEPATLVLAGISEEPAKILRRYQPLADYLVTHLEEADISVGQVKVAPDLETMSDWVANGEVDLFFDSLYPATTVVDRSGATPILRRWKGGVSEYHSVFFARADSQLTSLNDLQGQLFAFEDPFSTSGYMLPLAHLKEAGFNLSSNKFNGTNPSVGDDEIGYVFSGEDQNTIQWVITGKVAAGVTDNESYLELPETTREGLKILDITESLPRQVVLVRPNMDAGLRDDLTSVLLDMDESEAGQTVLEQFKTSQFDTFPKGAEAALERMREIRELVTQS